jgi:hypothetical protein
MNIAESSVVKAYLGQNCFAVVYRLSPADSKEIERQGLNDDMAKLASSTASSFDYQGIKISHALTNINAFPIIHSPFPVL